MIISCNKDSEKQMHAFDKETFVFIKLLVATTFSAELLCVLQLLFHKVGFERFCYLPDL